MGLALQVGIVADLRNDDPEGADSQGDGTELWERYGIESFCCVALREGCRASMAAGAALVFC